MGTAVLWAVGRGKAGFVLPSGSLAGGLPSEIAACSAQCLSEGIVFNEDPEHITVLTLLEHFLS